MSESILSDIACKVVRGIITLGQVHTLLGVDVAIKVHNLTITRPFQRVGWVRRVR